MFRSFLLAGVLAAAPALADVTLFENVRVFDGSGPELTAPVNVLVRDRLIERISPETIAPEPGATVIDGAGGTLMPGLIDAHWHAMLVRPTPAESIHGDIGFNNLIAGAEATDTLMRGFTTVRDMGGPVFGLKQAIDAGVVAGPRIYPSGAVITVTGGHGDFRQLSELPRTLGAPSSRMEELGGSMVADSPDEVRVRVARAAHAGRLADQADGGRRRRLAAQPARRLDLHGRGASGRRRGRRQLGHLCGGARLYVRRRSSAPIAAGVKVIEHGHLMDDATARLMAEQDIWLSTQPFVDDEDAVQFPPGSDQAAKKQAGDRRHRHGLRPGEEVRDQDRLRHRHPLLARRSPTRQGAWLARLVRWYTPAEALKMATYDNAELLALTGLRNPYPGRLGVVEEGALADLLLVDGDPIADIDLLADPGNLDVIMKDGRIYKNSRLGP